MATTREMSWIALVFVVASVLSPCLAQLSLPVSASMSTPALVASLAPRSAALEPTAADDGYQALFVTNVQPRRWLQVGLSPTPEEMVMAASVDDEPIIEEEDKEEETLDRGEELPDGLLEEEEEEEPYKTVEEIWEEVNEELKERWEELLPEETLEELLELQANPVLLELDVDLSKIQSLFTLFKDLNAAMMIVADGLAEENKLCPTKDDWECGEEEGAAEYKFFTGDWNYIAEMHGDAKRNGEAKARRQGGTEAPTPTAVLDVTNGQDRLALGTLLPRLSFEEENDRDNAVVYWFFQKMAVESIRSGSTMATDTALLKELHQARNDRIGEYENIQKSARNAEGGPGAVQPVTDEIALEYARNLRRTGGTLPYDSTSLPDVTEGQDLVIARQNELWKYVVNADVELKEEVLSDFSANMTTVGAIARRNGGTYPPTGSTTLTPLGGKPVLYPFREFVLNEEADSSAAVSTSSVLETRAVDGKPKAPGVSKAEAMQQVLEGAAALLANLTKQGNYIIRTADEDASSDEARRGLQKWARENSAADVVASLQQMIEAITGLDAVIVEYDGVYANAASDRDASAMLQAMEMQRLARRKGGSNNGKQPVGACDVLGGLEVLGKEYGEQDGVEEHIEDARGITIGSDGLPNTIDAPLKIGQSGEEVQAVQVMLSWMGYLKQPADGVFDKATADAFKTAVDDISNVSDPPSKYDGKTVTPDLYDYLRTKGWYVVCSKSRYSDAARDVQSLQLRGYLTTLRFANPTWAVTVTPELGDVPWPDLSSAATECDGSVDELAAAAALDPRNYLVGDLVAALQVQVGNYSGSSSARAQVAKVLKGSLLGADNATVDAFLEAGVESGLSPLFLAQTAVSEAEANGDPDMQEGVPCGGKSKATCYNIFYLSPIPKNNETATGDLFSTIVSDIQCLEADESLDEWKQLAVQRNWTSPDAAIRGGAVELADRLSVAATAYHQTFALRPGGINPQRAAAAADSALVLAGQMGEEAVLQVPVFALDYPVLPVMPPKEKRRRLASQGSYFRAAY